MITPKNIIKHELIGLTAEVAESANKFSKGLKGMVVDETKGTIVLETSDGDKKIQKKGTTFIFKISNGTKVKVSGDRIASRPEDRLKIKVKKW